MISKCTNCDEQFYKTALFTRDGQILCVGCEAELIATKTNNDKRKILLRLLDSMVM